MQECVRVVSCQDNRIFIAAGELFLPDAVDLSGIGNAGKVSFSVTFSRAEDNRTCIKTNKTGSLRRVLEITVMVAGDAVEGDSEFPAACTDFI